MEITLLGMLIEGRLRQALNANAPISMILLVRFTLVIFSQFEKVPASILRTPFPNETDIRLEQL